MKALSKSCHKKRQKNFDVARAETIQKHKIMGKSITKWYYYTISCAFVWKSDS